MKITALAENKTNRGLLTVHGLSLYIETKDHKLLFDVGPDETMFENAAILGIDPAAVDTVIISHGHRDHGGALSRFLEINKTAKIYVQRRAFRSHTSRPGSLVKNISLDVSLVDHPQIVLLDGAYKIDDELELFTSASTEKCYSYVNDCLYEDDKKDTFAHEQNLLIHGDKEVLVLGCGHSGIINILDTIKDIHVDVCVGGLHLGNPDTKERVDNALLNDIADAIHDYGDVKIYTCHCTGEDAFEYLHSKLANIHYLACGDSIGDTM